MADKRLPLRKLKKILAAFGVQWRDDRGKGSHVMFYAEIDGHRFSYPVPRRKDIAQQYVRGCRKKFRLLPEHGVTDDDFYSAG